MHMEHSIMEIMKWYLTFFFMLFLIAIVSFLMQVQDSNSIKQTVNYTIERSGGLTSEAVASLNEVSKNGYGDRFKVNGLLETDYVWDTAKNYPVKKGDVTKANQTDNVKTLVRVGDGYYSKVTTTPKVGFGDTVHYQVVLDMSILFFDIPVQTTFNGTSVSQIR